MQAMPYHLLRRASVSLLALLMVIFSFACTGSTSPARAATQGNLAWSDEFNPTSIDTTHWSVLTGSSFYTPRTLETYTTANVQVQGGALTLHSEGNGGSYTSAGVSSKGKFAFLYGKVEWRVKLPQGQGIWPALWMMPADGSSTYEIDALEAFGQDPSTILMTNHWFVDGQHPGITTRYTGANLSQSYHTISVTWLPDELLWQVDGVIRKETFTHIPNVPMFIYMNTAIGGWAGSAASTLSSDFSIDYVRVWQQDAAPVSGGRITGKLTIAPPKTNLTTLGTLDWATWGATAVNDNEHSQSGGNRISDFAPVGNGLFQQSGGSGTTLTWKGGAPQPSGVNAGRGVTTCGAGNGFLLIIPADQQSTTLRLYVTVWQTQGRLDAYFNDRSSPPLLDTSLSQSNGGQAGVYTITFQAPTNGDTLSVRWTVQSSTPGACIVLQGATLARTTTYTHAPRHK